MKNKYLGQVINCQICNNKSLTTILSLGHQPIVQEYLTSKTLAKPEATYPLNLARCSKCGLLQLDYIVDPKLVFPKNYPYRTGLTNMLIRNFRSLADTLFEKFKPAKNDLIIDIGSNDGTLLQGFKEKGMRVLGIEPTDAAKVANKKMADYYNRAAVIIMATSSDGCSVSFLEAMAMGKKIVATNLPYIGEWLLDDTRSKDNNLWLVPVKDVKLTAGAILAALKYPEKDFIKIAQTNRNLVINKAEIESNIDKLDQLYRKIL